MEMPEGWEKLKYPQLEMGPKESLEYIVNGMQAAALMKEMAEALEEIITNHHLRYEDADSVLDLGEKALNKFKEWE